MSKLKNYILNPETLMYEIKEVSARHRFWKAVLVLTASIGLSFLYIWIYTSVLGFTLPKTALLKRRNAEWVSKMEALNRRMDQSELALNALQLRDDEVYRSVFGMNPIPETMRNAGLGDDTQALQDDSRFPVPSLLSETYLRTGYVERRTYAQSKSFDEISSVARLAGDMVSCVPAIPPIDPTPSRYHLSSPFGYRTDPIYGGTRFHAGMDFAMPSGNPVYCTGDGKVESVSFELHNYGNSVVVNHGFGYKTRYAHMKVITVVEGMPVKRGDCLGESGNTGKASGPHLHYEVIYKGEHVNPAGFMDLSMSPDDYASMVDKRRSETEVALEPFSLRRRR